MGGLTETSPAGIPTVDSSTLPKRPIVTPTRGETIGIQLPNVRFSNNTQLCTVAARILNHTCLSRSPRHFTLAPTN